jgi:glutamate racemase
MSSLPLIVVMDWGIGGVDTLQRLHGRVAADWVYLSDSGQPPYGLLSDEALQARIRAVAEAFAPDLLVVACNAASAALVPNLCAGRLVGVIAPGIALTLRQTAPGSRIGILGGRRTIEAGLHAEAFALAGRLPVARVAQPLSAHVEAGRLSGAELDADLLPLVAALADCDAVLLACTHYPALLPRLAELLPAMRWLDPVEELVEQLAAVQLVLGEGEVPRAPQMLTTGDAQASELAAKLAFGAAFGPFERVVLTAR